MYEFIAKWISGFILEECSYNDADPAVVFAPDVLIDLARAALPPAEMRHVVSEALGNGDHTSARAQKLTAATIRLRAQRALDLECRSRRALISEFPLFQQQNFEDFKRFVEPDPDSFLLLLDLMKRRRRRHVAARGPAIAVPD